jgi:gas vesicle protein
MSSKKNNIKELTLSHPKIINFYKTYPHLDIETTNLWTIDILEHLFQLKHQSDQTNVLSNQNKLQTKLLEKVQTVLSSLDNNLTQHTIQTNQQTINIQTSISELPHTLKDQLNSQFLIIRDHYNNMLEKSFDGNHMKLKDQFRDMIDTQFTDKLKHTFDDSIWQKFSKELHTAVSTINQYISTSAREISSGNGENQKSVIEQFQHQVQSQYSTLQQTIQQFQTTHQSDSETITSIQEYLDRQKNSSFKGQDSENKVEVCLNQTFPDANIVNTTGQSKSGDFFIHRSSHDIPILIENKDYSNNVPPAEVEKFIRDIDHHKCHGIFISQHSGISRRKNFQIDIHNQRVLVYIHNVMYDFEKVKLAVFTIDQISQFMDRMGIESDDCQISMEELEKINDEFKINSAQKNMLIDSVRSFEKDIIKKIQSLEYPNLHRILCKHFSSTIEIDNASKCYLCNELFKNKRAVAAHMKKCKRQHASNFESPSKSDHNHEINVDI